MVCCGSRSRGTGPGKFAKVGTSDLGFGNGACLPGGEKLKHLRQRGVVQGQGGGAGEIHL